MAELLAGFPARLEPARVLRHSEFAVDWFAMNLPDRNVRKAEQQIHRAVVPIEGPNGAPAERSG